MQLLQIVILMIFGTLSLYLLISRICQCVEHCANAKYYAKALEKGVEPNAMHSNGDEKR